MKPMAKFMFPSESIGMHMTSYRNHDIWSLFTSCFTKVNESVFNRALVIQTDQQVVDVLDLY